MPSQRRSKLVPRTASRAGLKAKNTLEEIALMLDVPKASIQRVADRLDLGGWRGNNRVLADHELPALELGLRAVGYKLLFREESESRLDSLAGRTVLLEVH
jgi:hypothetical protein